MGYTTAQFVLHRDFVDEGDYDIWLNGIMARVKVERIQNIEGMQKIMEGFQFLGTVDMTHDQYGIFSIFKVTITLPYYLEFGELEAKCLFLISTATCILR